ncbi:MAG: type II toxin-antitoxin system HicB family antitoxin [Pyrinomonadaceae bacterium]
MKNGNSPKYEIVIYWDNDDKIFVAEVPDLAGCMAHGKTRIEAAQHVSEAIELGWKRPKNLETRYQSQEVINWLRNLRQLSSLHNSSPD